MADLPIPIRDYLTDLEAEFNTTNTGNERPQFLEATEDNKPIYFNLTAGDTIVGKMGLPSFEETPIGNWRYVNRLYNIELELYTSTNRQQLYNLVQEIRRLVYSRRHKLENYQRIQWQQFNELPEGKTNIWHGTIRIQLVNDAVYVG
jgi:hypothetical protein